MLPKLLLTVIISVVLLTNVTTATITTTTTTTTNVAASAPTTIAAAGKAETTTSLLPLQPPLNVTSTTTSSFVSEQPNHHSRNSSDNVAVMSDRLLSDSANTRREHQTDENLHVQFPGANQTDYIVTKTGYHPAVSYENNSNQSLVSANFVPGQVFVPASQLNTNESKLHSNSHGYINFEPNDEEDKPAAVKLQKRKGKKTETVNEVLSSLFPNGFSDIFRFSYAAEPSTENTSKMPIITTSKPKTITTKISPISTTTLAPQNQTFYSFQASISKEYRRKTRPGHTEIVVEKLEMPARPYSEEFKDGSNLITKDDLLRINRAAVDASVLPSLLMKPTSANATEEQTLLTANGPIVILNDNSDEIEENIEDDNQIAESQQIGHVFQRLPETNQAYPYKDDIKSNTRLQEQKQEINVQIIHDDNLKKTADAGQYTQRLFTPAAEFSAEKQAMSLTANTYPRENRASHELDHFQEHAEKNFQQRNLVQEAPSRKFLKHFNPVLTEGDNGPISRGNFHYEANTPKSTTEYSDQYVRPAAQLVYEYETHHIQNQQTEQQQPQQQQQQQLKQPHQELSNSDYNQEYREQQQQLFNLPQTTSDNSEHQQEVQENQFNQLQQSSEYQQNFQQEQQLSEPKPTHETSKLHTRIYESQPVSTTPLYQDYQSSESGNQHDSVTPSGLVFVTVSTPKPQSQYLDSSSHSFAPPSHSKSPHEYVAEAVAAIQQHSQLQHKTIHALEEQASQNQPQYDEADTPQTKPHQEVVHDYEVTAAASQTQAQHEVAPEPIAKPNAGYTFVEVQKSINIHNKLITERDGQLVEQHETIYPLPQYGQRLRQPATQQHQQHQQQQLLNQPEIRPKEYVSLSANPIHVQHIDYEIEHQEEAASHDALQHSPPPLPNEPQTPSQQQQITYVEKLVPQPYPIEVEKIVERPYPVTQIVEKKVPEPYPVQQVIEKIVDRPVEVEKIIDRPVKVPYPVHVDHYIDRPYPVKEIVEKHVHVPYPVPEPVAVPVHIDHYYDRPYPVETIVEKPVPYPVETVVEKVVEKHVPVEVERIVEKPVDRFVEKFVDRPIGIPIHVPVAMPVPMIYGPHSSSFPPTLSGHPNTLSGWAQPGASLSHSTIPAKVLQNYYARMLKKLLPQMTLKANKPSAATTGKAQTSVSKAPAKRLKSEKSPSTSSTAKKASKPTYKITDIRFDLKPPPPPSAASWSQGARYIYNTLPLDLDSSAASAPASQSTNQYGGGSISLQGKEPYDEFQRWRNGHSLKRSPEFGRNLHVEYGFKPPLVPSLEIDEKGVPLNSGIAKVVE